MQPSVKKRRKWLVPICMNDHWISAVSFRRNVTNLKSRFEEFVSVLIVNAFLLLQIIEVEEHLIKVLDSLHIAVTKKISELSYICNKIIFHSLLITPQSILTICISREFRLENSI